MILVTGASGTLGSVLVPKLLARGEQARALSRRSRAQSGTGTGPGAEWVVGDLATGAGLDQALAGVDVIVHAATDTRRGGKGDVEATRRLIEAAKRSGRRPHLVYISIVGVDRHPFGYYRTKFACEQAIEESGLPHTILRTTQWYQLLAMMFGAVAKVPLVMPVPSAPFQPMEVAEVAARLAEIAVGDPLGRAEDLGGPEVLVSTAAAREYLRAAGKKRVVLPVRLPGKAGKAFREGVHMVPGHRQGKRTWAEFLGGRFGG